MPLWARSRRLRLVGTGRSLWTTNGSATWPDPLRPVHRHEVGARELPIGGSSTTVAVATRQKEYSSVPENAELRRGVQPPIATRPAVASRTTES
jgi:hypothetical protein